MPFVLNVGTSTSFISHEVTMKVLMIDGGGFSPPYDFCLASGLESIGIRVDLLMPQEVVRDWRNPDAIPNSSSSRARSMMYRLAKGSRYLATLLDAERMIRRGAIDVVHMQWLAFSPADRAFLKSIRGRVRTVYTMHNTSTFHEPASGIQGLGKREAYKLFDKVIVHSEYSLTSATASGVARKDQLACVPHGAFDYYRELSTVARDESAKMELLFVGSIKHYKGLDVLVESLAYLCEMVPRGTWHLTVAGKPSISTENLRRRITELGLDDSVTWRLRHQSERELANLFSSSHLVILPYREIDQSGVLLAAIGMGRAVLATRVGAFPEILDQIDPDLLIPPEDPTALAKALARLIKQPSLINHQELLMQRLADGELGWKSVAEKTLKVYEG